MTTRLKVRQGGGSASVINFADINPANRKGAPFLERDTPLVQMGQKFSNGEAAVGSFQVIDPFSDLPASNFRLRPHATVELTLDDSGTEYHLAWMRIAPHSDHRRGPYVPGDEVVHDVTVHDCNRDLDGIPFETGWSRPAETDWERLQALQAAKLAGAGSNADLHRNTTTITVDRVSNDHLVEMATQVDLDAKEYPAGTHVREVIEDCASQAGKIWGVVLHHEVGVGTHRCLMYVESEDHTSYTSSIKISDEVSEWDPWDPTNPVYEPNFTKGQNGSYVDNDFVISGLISIYDGSNDNPTSVFVETGESPDDWEVWVDVYNDGDSDNLTQATRRANRILNERKRPHVTNRCSILVRGDQTHLITAGQSIEIKSAVIAGGPFLGTYVTRRVAEVMWEPAFDGLWWAHLFIDRPMRTGAPSGGAGQPVSTTPDPPPDPPDPPTPGTGCVTSFTRTWSYNTSVNSDSADYPFLDNWVSGSGGAISGPHGVNALSYDEVPQDGLDRIAVSPGDTITFAATISARANSLATRWFKAYYFATDDASDVNPISISTKTAPASSNSSTATFTLEWVVPAGAGGFQLQADRQLRLDNVTLTVADCSGATEATPGDTPSDVGPPGSGDVGTPGCYATCDHVHGHGTEEGTDGGTYQHLVNEVEQATTSSNSDPTVTDDEDAGFIPGWEWINTTTGAIFVLIDSTVGAADWVPIAFAGGSLGGGSEQQPDLNLPIPAWVNPTGSGVITADPQGRITIDSGAGYKGFLGAAIVDGEYWLVYRQGTDHATTLDGDIKLKRLSLKGAVLSTATIATHSSGHDFRNPTILRHSSGRVLVSYRDWEGGTTSEVQVISLDHIGGSWSSPYSVPDTFANTVDGSSPMIELPDGSIAMPIYGKDSGDTFFSQDVIFSIDQGASFSGQVRIADGQAASRHYEEGVIHQVAGVGLVCLLRSDTTDHTYRSVSTDGGQTWSAATDVLTATGRPDFIEFYPGALIAFLRNNGTDNDGRWTVSWDAGATWTALQEIDSGVTQNEEYAAPVLLAPGLVMVAYGLETSSTDSDLYLRYYFDGYGTDVLGQIRSSGLFIDGVEIDVAGAADGEVLTYDSGTGKIVLEANAASVTEAQIRDIGHWEVIVSGTAPPVATTNEAEDDWVVGWVSG